MATDVGSIIARLILDRSNFTDNLAAARAEATAFPDIESKLSLDTSRYDEGLARALSERGLLDRAISSAAALDTSRFYAAAAAVEAMKGALSRDVEIPVRFAVTSAGTAIDMERQSWLNTLAGATAGSAIAGAGGNTTKRVDVFYHASGESGGGGGGGAGGILSALLWGGGSKIPLLGAAAGFGSLASFAGLGPEHLALTGLGLAGSLAGGALGGGLLAAGALGVGAVGAGTDLAGIGQAAGDIKTVYSDMSNLNQAIAVYGKTSQQAADAQAQLNYDLSGFSPVAKGAVVQATTAAQQLKAMFDAATGPAEKTGAQIITQGLQVAQSYIPTIGDYAAVNMRIIQSGLQPLFAWLQGPGVAIFSSLEQVFTNNLPTAVHIFSQAVEFVAQTLQFLSGQVGGILPKIDAFITKWNSTEGFARWETVMTHLIGDFHLWWDLIKAVGTDIYRLFSNDAGTANAIVTAITGMLQKLGDWEASTQGKADIHNIFEVHKQEILSMLQLLPSLVSSFGNIYLHVAPALTGALTTVLQAIDPILNALAKNPAGAWVLGLSLIAARLGILGPILGPIGRGLATLGGILLGMAWGTIAPLAKSFAESMYLLAIMGWEKIVGGLRSAAGAMFSFDAAADANPIGAIIVAMALLGLACYELVTHFKTVTDFLKGTWGTVILGAIAVIDPFIGLPLIIYEHWAGFSGFFDGVWQTVDRDTRNWFGDVEKYMLGVGSAISTDAQHWSSNVWHVLDSAWQQVDASARRWWGDIESFFIKIGQGILFVFTVLPGQILKIGEGVVNSLIQGIESVNLGSLIGGWLHNEANKFLAPFGIHLSEPSASTTFFKVGQQMMMSWVAGIEAHSGKLVTTSGAVAHAAANAVTGGLAAMGAPGGTLGQWIGAALAATGAPPAWAGALATIIAHESGGNPNAINLTDSNALAGHPSQGLMQTIPSTFAAYALPGYGGITNPIANIIAGIRYIEARYGSVFNVPGIVSMSHGGPYVGYAGGTPFAPGGWGWVGEQGPELMYVPRGAKVLPHGQSSSFGGGVSMNSNHNVYVNVQQGDPKAVQAAVCRALEEHDKAMFNELRQLAGVNVS